MATRKILQYLSCTQAGDWWTVQIGHVVNVEGYKKPFVVTGWDRFGVGPVILAQDRLMIEKWPEEIDMRYINKPRRSPDQRRAEALLKSITGN